MLPRFKSLRDLERAFPTEQACIDYLEETIWKGKTPISPFDPASKVIKCADQKTSSKKYPAKYSRYKCMNTGEYFNVKSITIFRNSKMSLRDWFTALYLFSSHTKRISSYQLAKHIGITQKTAWFTLHRLREASNCPIFKTILKGFVEIDETLIGGSNPNRHWDKKVPNCQGRSGKDKTTIWGGRERGGNLICRVVPDAKRKTLEPIIRENIKQGSNVYTDEWLAYNNLGKRYNHQIVNHRKKQYVNGEATTNRIENAWSHLKKNIYGIYHWTSKKHLFRYIDEFTFHFNARDYSIQERFDLLLASSVGKRLTYRELIG